MYTRLDNCPLCQSGQIFNQQIIKDYSISQEEFALSECKKCGLIFTNPRPDQDQLGKYYESSQYLSHHDHDNTLIAKVYKRARNYTLKQKLKLANHLNDHQKGRWLDIGCGLGHLLYTAKSDGWNVVGVEPNEQAAIASSNKINQLIYPTLQSSKAEKKYDIITLYHVLEHVYDLNETIDFIKTKIKKKGHIIIAVPNPESWDALHYKNFWAGYDVPRHLYHFKQDTIHQMAKIHGMKIKEIIPMKLDAFYVSLLSEKYKTGKSNYLKAFQNGLKSNNWAKQNKLNYSSLIYILKK